MSLLLHGKFLITATKIFYRRLVQNFHVRVHTNACGYLHCTLQKKAKIFFCVSRRIEGTSRASCAHIRAQPYFMPWSDKNWRSLKFRVQLGRARDVGMPIQRLHPCMSHLPRHGSGVADQHVGVVRGAGYGAASPAHASAGSWMPAIMRHVAHKQMHNLHTHVNTLFTHIPTYSRTHTLTYMKNVCPVHEIIHHMSRAHMRQSAYTRTHTDTRQI